MSCPELTCRWLVHPDRANACATRARGSTGRATANANTAVPVTGIDPSVTTLGVGAALNGEEALTDKTFNELRCKFPDLLKVTKLLFVLRCSENRTRDSHDSINT